MHFCSKSHVTTTYLQVCSGVTQTCHMNSQISLPAVTVMHVLANIKIQFRFQPRPFAACHPLLPVSFHYIYLSIYLVLSKVSCFLLLFFLVFLVLLLGLLLLYSLCLLPQTYAIDLVPCLSREILKTHWLSRIFHPHPWAAASPLHALRHAFPDNTMRRAL